MGLEIYNGKRVELFILGKQFRWAGKCVEVTDGFLIIENDRDGRIMSFRISELETIREVRL